MQIKKNVVANIDGESMVIDLADFPHGKLSSVRKDQDYDIEFYDVQDGVMVSAYDSETGHARMFPVKYWSIHRGKAVEIVNLEDGRQIITDNDPRAVYGVACDADDVVPSRFTPSEAMDRHVLVPVVDDALAEDISGMYYCFSDGKICRERTEYSVVIDFMLGQFVGVMAGDGWAANNRQTWLADNEGFNKDFIVNYLRENVFPNLSYSSYERKFTDAPGRYGDTTTYRISVGTSCLADRIKELIDGHGDEVTSGSANKRLPVWYQFAGKDFILGLVNGMIATDGTVCVCHGKKKPQLQISFSSTSLRLSREFRRCCQLLGVRASISFSKNTSGGNTAWICSVSTVDAKKIGLLNRCCHERKREIFLGTSVDMSDRNVRNDIIPFPRGVAERIVPLVPAAKTHGLDLDALGEEEKARRLKYQSTAINVRAHATKGFITRGLVRRISEIGEEIADRNMRRFTGGMKALLDIRERFEGLLNNDDGGSRRSWKVKISNDEIDAIYSAIGSVRTSGRICHGWREDTYKPTQILGNARKKGFITWSQLNDVVAFFDKRDKPNTELIDSKDLDCLMRMAESDVTWLRIKSVEKTGKVEIGYDLTVPGPDTFVSDDGVVLSNTVNIHVPASMKAANQALEKMLPSKNLFSLTDMKAMRYKPEKEQISGLWALTRGKTRKPTKYFNSKSEAIAAYRNGEIGPNDPVDIKMV